MCAHRDACVRAHTCIQAHTHIQAHTRGPQRSSEGRANTHMDARYDAMFGAMLGMREGVETRPVNNVIVVTALL